MDLIHIDFHVSIEGVVVLQPHQPLQNRFGPDPEVMVVWEW
jgi:hypothetical protein